MLLELQFCFSPSGFIFNKISILDSLVHHPSKLKHKVWGDDLFLCINISINININIYTHLKN